MSSFWALWAHSIFAWIQNFSKDHEVFCLLWYFAIQINWVFNTSSLWQWTALCGCVVGRKSGSFIILEEHKRELFLSLYCWSLRPLLEFCVQFWSTQYRYVGASPEKNHKNYQRAGAPPLWRHRAATVQPAEEKVLRSFLTQTILWLS